MNRLQNYENANGAVGQTLPERKKGATGYFIVGLLILALAIFGAVRLGMLCVGGLKASAQEKQQQRLAAYARLLIPAAAIDIEPFDDITGAKMSELVEMSVWSVLNAVSDPTIYSISGGELQIPAPEVEGAYTAYFGTEVPIIHCTVSGYGYEFVYDDVADVYKIPLTTISPLYTPKVVAVETKGDSTVVTCGLIYAGLYTQDPVSGELRVPEPDKYLKVTLRETGGASVIRAIRNSGLPETAAVSPTGQTETAAPDAAVSETMQSETAGTEEETAQSE